MRKENEEHTTPTGGVLMEQEHKHVRQEEAPYIGFMGRDVALLKKTSEFEAERFVSHVAKEADVKLTWRKDLISIIVVNLGSEEDIPKVIETMFANRHMLRGSVYPLVVS